MLVTSYNTNARTHTETRALVQLRPSTESHANELALSNDFDVGVDIVLVYDVWFRFRRICFENASKTCQQFECVLKEIESKIHQSLIAAASGFFHASNWLCLFVMWSFYSATTVVEYDPVSGKLLKRYQSVWQITQYANTRGRTYTQSHIDPSNKSEYF